MGLGAVGVQDRPRGQRPTTSEATILVPFFDFHLSRYYSDKILHRSLTARLLSSSSLHRLIIDTEHHLAPLALPLARIMVEWHLHTPPDCHPVWLTRDSNSQQNAPLSQH